MNRLGVMAILVDKRTVAAPKVQEILTRYGDSILLRVGMHDPGEEQHGLITLNVRDKDEKINRLSGELEELQGVTVKTLIL